ncbi:MAG: cysteine-rich CWC family protein [Psychrosphaera sp.]|nr:cysteine-rich CWC family protein [Psychrosphaera sp.]
MKQIDESKCPLCGDINRCSEVDKKQGKVVLDPCWCHGVKFTRQVLKAVPKEARNKACICESCVAKLSLVKAV